MQRRTLLWLSIVLAMVAASLAACGGSTSPARITSATMAKGYDETTHRAVDPTTTFAPGDRTTWLVVKVAGATAGTTVRAVYSIPATGEVILDEEAPMDAGSDTVYFEMTNKQDWPAGQYKVDLYLDGELNQTLEYQVS